jgi:hypothetical protein
MADTTTNKAPKIVRVACKLPHGLFLELRDPPPPIDFTKPFAPMDLSYVRPPRFSIKLNGANTAKNEWNSGLVRVMAPRYDFGITDIPEDVWIEWEKKWHDHPFIKGGFIFALPRLKDVIAEAKVRAPEKTGLEPLSPDVASDARFKNMVAIPGRPETHVETDLEHLQKLQRRNDRDIEDSRTE